MNGEFKKHKLAYLTLIVVLVAFTILFLGTWPNRAGQRWLALAVPVFYIIWGVITHVQSSRLNKKVFLEYVGVGLLAGIFLLLVTL